MLNRQDIEFVRGDDVEVELKLFGDFTSKTAYFTIKEKDDITGVRYVDLSTGSGIVATYSDPFTTFVMTIPKANTNQLTFSEMVFDLVFDEDTTKIIGKVKLIHETRSPFDDSVIPDALASSSIIVQRPTASGITSFSVSSLILVYDATLSGDLVIVKNGTYDVEDNPIQLKDGVNWKFEGNPTISSDSTDGTFYDDNSNVSVHFDGDVVIENTNGLGSRIILQHASSVISGFKWVYDVRLKQAGSDEPTVSATYKNTLGGTPAWEIVATGKYTATLTGGFSSNAKVTITFVDRDEVDKALSIIPFTTTADVITIVNYGLSGDTLTNVFNYINLRVEVRP